MPVSRMLDRHGPYVPVLLVGRLADTVTTLYGLRISGIYERNALVASMIEVFGAGAGMLLANLFSILTVVIVVELGISILGSDGPVRERAVVEVGYLPAVALSFGAAAYNVGIIAMA